MSSKAPRPLDVWRSQVTHLAVRGNPLRVPEDVFLREAGQVAGFVFDYWQPDGDRPGLKSVEGVLSNDVAADIIGLVMAVQEAHAEELVVVKPLGKDTRARMRFLLKELKAALAFLLDDEVIERADHALNHVRKEEARSGRSLHADVYNLSAYANVAREVQDRLVKADRSFQPSLIDEALSLCSPDQRVAPTADEAAAERARDARVLRYQLLQLLIERVGTVRWAAGRVFRHHPEILRQVTSQHARRSRRAQRDRKRAAPPVEKAKDGG